VRAAGGEPVPARFRQTAIPTEFSYLLSSSRQPTCATEEFGGDALFEFDFRTCEINNCKIAIFAWYIGQIAGGEVSDVGKEG